MDTRPQSHHSDAITTNDVQHDVELIHLPYLHHQIDPEDLQFEEGDPLKSAFIRAQTLTLQDDSNTKEYAVYIMLGEGGNGRVYLAQDTQTQEWVAIKKAKLYGKIEPDAQKKNEAIKTLFSMEAEKLQKVKNLKLYDEGNATLVMNLLEGVCLENLIEKDKEEKLVLTPLISFHQALRVAREIIFQTRKLHEHYRLLHRDIKPLNYLLKSNHRGKFCDLGIARSFKKIERDETGKIKQTFSSSTHSGTKKFYPPEIARERMVKEKYIYGEDSDVYALGETLKDIFNKAEMPADIRKFLDQMTDPDYTKRPSLPKVEFFFATYKMVKAIKPPTICILSIDDLLKDDLKENTIQTILDNKINIVVLKGSTTNKVYYQARHLLMTKGVPQVAPFMVKGEDENKVNQTVKHYYHKKFHTPPKIFKCKYQPVKEKKDLPYFYQSPHLADCLIGAVFGLFAVGAAALIIWSGGLAIPALSICLAVGLSVPSFTSILFPVLGQYVFSPISPSVLERNLKPKKTKEINTTYKNNKALLLKSKKNTEDKDDVSQDTIGIQDSLACVTPSTPKNKKEIRQTQVPLLSKVRLFSSWKENQKTKTATLPQRQSSSPATL